LNIRRIITLIIITTVLLFPSKEVNAQSEIGNYPVYIVQPGDTINVISLKFNVSAADIIAANSISDPNLLSVNTRLVIPGIEGVSGVLTYNAVSIGENPDSLSREFQIPKETIYRLNRTTSPSEFYVGSNVILVETPSIPLGKSTLAPSETLLEKSIKNNLPLWETIFINQIDSPWNVLPNEKIVLSVEEVTSTDEEIEFIGLPLTQGQTTIINVKSNSQLLNGKIGDINFQFFENGSTYSSIFGIHAMLPPGLYPFHLEYLNQAQQNIVVDQLILIQKGFYPEDPPLQVDPSTLDETQTKPEDELVFNVTIPFNSVKYWTGVFKYPVDPPVCIKSWFGNRRSYNNQPYNRFHTGVDFGVCANLNIYAPADGKVVFTDSLLTRGNSTIIDHGLGVYSGFWHQETILVEEGQFVKAGDLIGMIGTTGRSTGPHLHWELVVNGVQVDPLPWLETIFP
jgi:murein DD-endopeptidase MepM/ murein hydrolase activator NlpD